MVGLRRALRITGGTVAGLLLALALAFGLLQTGPGKAWLGQRIGSWLSSPAERVDITGIGGLVNYRRRIIAIGEELIDMNPNYMATVRSCLDRRGDPSTLEIMSVSSVVKMLRSAKHAHQA